MARRYELHQVEREAENEGWIWVRDEELQETTHDRRPVLRLRCASESVCCETLWADPLFLRNRRYPILIGKITDFVSQSDFRVVDEEGVATRVRCQPPTRFEPDDAKGLINDRHVCVRGNIRTDSGPVRALSVTFDFKDNLVFLSGWYRRRLGIKKKHGEIINLDIMEPKSRLKTLQTMCWQLRACALHPQIAVVMSTVLAVVGTGLGIVGLAAVLKDVHWPGSVWGAVVSAIAVFGFAVFFLGFRPLYLRAKN